GSNVVIYINGIASKSASVTGNLVSNINPVIISPSGSMSFNGTIDGFRILNRALTPEEILEDYEYGLNKYANGKMPKISKGNAPNAIIKGSGKANITLEWTEHDNNGAVNITILADGTTQKNANRIFDIYFSTDSSTRFTKSAKSALNTTRYTCETYNPPEVCANTPTARLLNTTVAYVPTDESTKITDFSDGTFSNTKIDRYSKITLAINTAENKTQTFTVNGSAINITNDNDVTAEVTSITIRPETLFGLHRKDAVSWWTLDATDITDQSSLNNGTTTATIINNNLYFNGSTYAVVSNSPSLQIEDNLTITGWAMFNDTANQPTVFGKKTSYDIHLDADTNISARIYAGGWYETVSDIQITEGSWYHMAATYDRINLTLYINGTKVSDTPATDKITVFADNFYMGAQGTTAGFLNGTLKDIAVYNRTLSSKEIEDLYKNNEFQIADTINMTDQSGNEIDLSIDWQDTMAYNITIIITSNSTDKNAMIGNITSDKITPTTTITGNMLQIKSPNDTITYDADTSISANITINWSEGNYCPQGTYTSKIFDVGVNLNLTDILIDSSIDINRTVNIQIKTANTTEDIETEQFIGPDGTEGTYYNTTGSINTTQKIQHFMYRITLNTTDTSMTPDLKNITFNYRADRPEPAGYTQPKILKTDAEGFLSYPFWLPETAAQTLYTLKINTTKDNIIGENTTSILWAPTTVAEIIIPYTSIDDFVSGTDYTTTLNATIKNTGNGSIFNPILYSTIAPAQIKDITIDNNCPTIPPKEQCNTSVDITLKGSAAIDTYGITWKLNYTTNDETETSETNTSIIEISGNPAFSTSIDDMTLNTSLSTQKEVIIIITNTGNEMLTDVKVNTTDISQDWVSYSSPSIGWTGDGWSAIDTTFSSELHIYFDIKNESTHIYTANLKITTDNGPTKTIPVTINVSPEITVPETHYATAEHNRINVLNYIVNSTGNIKLVDTQVTYIQNTLPASWLSFTQNLGNITENTHYNLSILATIPDHQDTGNYTGTLIISTGNLPSRQSTLNLYILPDGSWHFETQQIYEKEFNLNNAETIGNVTIHNTGNMPIQFQMTYDENVAGYSSCSALVCLTKDIDADTNPTQFTVEKDTISTFDVYQNGKSFANYNIAINMTMTNSSATPQSSYVFFLFNITDTPPVVYSMMTKVDGQQQNFVEIGKNITLDIILMDDETDGINQSSVYINITKNATTAKYIPERTNYPAAPGFMDGEQFTYVCTDTVWKGNYTYTIYGLDQSGQPTAEQGWFMTVDATNLTLSADNLTTDNVGYNDDLNINFSLSIINDGYVSAYNITINNSQRPTGWIIGNISLDNIAKNIILSRDIPMTIPKDTPHGTYEIQEVISWQDPNSDAKNKTYTFYTIVGKNQSYTTTLSEGQTFNVDHDSHNYYSFNIEGIGNDDAPLTITAVEPEDIEMKFSIDGLNYYDSLPILVLKGETLPIFVDFNVSEGVSPGNKNAQVSIVGQTTTDRNIKANVQSNYDWDIDRNRLTINAVSNQNTQNNDINIVNEGNLPNTFTITIAGNATAFMGIVNQNPTVAVSDNTSVILNYTAFEENNKYVAQLNITDVGSGNTVIKTVDIEVNTFTMDLSIINISPDTEIIPDNIIGLTANLIFGQDVITGNTTYKVSINGSECTVISTVIMDNNTLITCTAPYAKDAEYHDVSIQADYSSSMGIVSVRTTNASAIYYHDVTAPQFENLNADDVIYGNTTTLTVIMTDNIGTDTVTATITAPESLNTTDIILAKLNGTHFTYNLSDLTELGDYKVTYYANDSAGNTRSKIDYFEHYKIKDLVHQFIKPTGEIIQNMKITFYRPDTAEIMNSVDTGESGNISLNDLHVRSYDIKLSYNDYNFTFHDFEITENMSILFNMDEKDQPTNIIPRATDNRLKLFAFTEHTNFSKVDVEIDYSNNIPPYEEALRLFRCENWSISQRSCNGLWQSPNDNNGLPDIDTMDHIFKATIYTFSGYVLAEDDNIISTQLSVEGDGKCNIDYGESCSSPDCIDDGRCTSVGTSSGGGGGGSSGTTGALTNDTFYEQMESLKDNVEQIVSRTTDLKGVRVDAKAIEKQLYTGETTDIKILLENTKNITSTLYVSSDGNIKSFITFDKGSITLGALEKSSIIARINIPSDTIPGTYDGIITIVNPEESMDIPVNIRVLETKEKLLDLKIQPYQQNLVPGDTLTVQADVYNLGKTKRVDIQLLLQIVDPVTGEIFAEVEESIAVETTISVMKKIQIPEDMILGRYIVKGYAYYTNNNQSMQASSLNYITIEKKWYNKSFMGLKIMYYTLIIALIMMIFLSRYGYQYYAQHNKKYKIKVNPALLPKATDRSAFIGKVAETDMRTFLPLDKLQMHTLVAGATGGGKSIAAQVIVEEALKSNVSVIVFDPTAQWSGFLRKLKEKNLLEKYSDFGMKQADATDFNGNIFTINDAREVIDIKEHVKPGEITVFTMNKIDPKDIDIFIANTVRQVFKANLPESKELKLLMVYDEIHRLLPKFGGSGEGFLQIERGAREFRKWGVGLVLISQVLSDFIGSIKANIGTEVQVRTRDEDDLKRINMKYGEDLMKSIVKASIGTGMVMNADYNKGQPYFVAFRPILHSVERLSDEILDKYYKYNTILYDLKYQIQQLKELGVDTFDLDLEIKLALSKIKKGKFNMVDIYLQGLTPRIEDQWKKLGKTPKKKEQAYVTDQEIQEEVEKAKKEREKYIEDQKKEEKKHTDTKTDDNIQSNENESTQSSEEDSQDKEIQQEKVKIAPKKDKVQYAYEYRTKKQKTQIHHKIRQTLNNVKKTKKVDIKIPRQQPPLKNRSNTIERPMPKTKIEQIESLFEDMQKTLSEKRRVGKDTSIIDYKISSIKSDIGVAKATGDPKDIEDVDKKLRQLKTEIKGV
ncbi:MAG: DUF87 domain-containing protein, partial [Nanohaloarchaea archaeon]|nr:DUF87 domain-containing protein [Candidatus Nanohaloarchaea archaeon]